MRSALEYKLPLEGEAPKPAGQQTFVVSSVIFADGTYEGDAFRAAQFRAYSLGRKLQVKQLIALIQSNETNFSGYSFNKFVEQTSKLETKINEQEFGALLKQFPTLNEKEKAYLRDGVENTSENVKTDFLSGMKRYQDVLESKDAGAYLKGLREQYQKWLVRLQ